jgi:methylmalonyl-CoA/ethylmalonyl-CoA epimerase
MKFHHIGILVSNLSYGLKIYKKIYKNLKHSKTIIDKKIGVKLKFIHEEDKILYELIAPYGKSSPITKLIKNKTSILNHVAYKEKKFDEKIKYFKKNNFLQISEPLGAKAFKGKRVVFFMTPLHHIIELIED